MMENDVDYMQAALIFKKLRQKRLGELAQQVADGKLSFEEYREEEKRFLSEVGAQ